MPKIRFALVLLVVLTLAPKLSAQSENGTIRGNVQDQMAASLPGVKITATNTKTKETYKATTNESGEYRLAVAIGIYEISAELPGFSSVKVSNVTVKENESTGMATLTMKNGGTPSDIQRVVIPIPLAPEVQPSNRL
jgi:phosphatidate phosphatase APP1